MSTSKYPPTRDHRLGRSLLGRTGRGHRRHHPRFQGVAGRQGPAQCRVPLGHHVQLHALPRRRWWSTPPSAASSTRCGISRARLPGCPSTCCWAASAGTRCAATRRADSPRRAPSRLIAKYGYTALKSHALGFTNAVPYQRHRPRRRQRSRGRAQSGRTRMSTCASTPTPRIFEPYVALRHVRGAEAVHPLFSRRADPAWRTWTPWPTSAARSRYRSPPARSLYTKFQFQQLLTHRRPTSSSPTSAWPADVLEQKKIAAMAEAHYVEVAPHNPLGPLATLVNIHFAASTPNFSDSGVPPGRRIARARI